MVSGMEKTPPTLRDLYPDLNEEQLAEVEDSLERYLALVMRIFNRLESESDCALPQLTAANGEIPCKS